MVLETSSDFDVINLKDVEEFIETNIAEYITSYHLITPTLSTVLT